MWEFAAGTGWSPVYRNPGDKAGGKSGQADTISSHYGQYWTTQDHLQEARKDWWANGCHPSNTSDPTGAAQVESQADRLANYSQPPPTPDPEQARPMEGITRFILDSASSLWLPKV